MEFLKIYNYQYINYEINNNSNNKTSNEHIIQILWLHILICLEITSVHEKKEKVKEREKEKKNKDVI